jgi:FkbM family methyltransferase
MRMRRTSAAFDGMLRELKGRVSRLFGAGPFEQLASLRASLGEGPTIVEAGAHNGLDTVWLSRLFPGGTVHAFEPVPDLYARLTRRTKGLANVRTYNRALGARSGQAIMHVSTGSSDGSSSLLRPTGHLEVHPKVTFAHSLQVPCVSLDDWARENGIAKVDLLWLDLQGLEFDVLSTSSLVLPTVKAIYTEVSLKEMYEGARLYPDYRCWLEGQGFEVVAEDLRWKDMGNVLLARPGSAAGMSLSGTSARTSAGVASRL